MNYPPDWPKCPACGEPALDGKATCGRVTCSALFAQREAELAGERLKRLAPDKAIDVDAILGKVRRSPEASPLPKMKYEAPKVVDIPLGSRDPRLLQIFPAQDHRTIETPFNLSITRETVYFQARIGSPSTEWKGCEIGLVEALCFARELLIAVERLALKIVDGEKKGE